MDIQNLVISMCILLLIVVLTVSCVVIIPRLKQNNDVVFNRILGKIEGFVEVGNSVLKVIDTDPNKDNIVEKIFKYSDSLVKTAERIPVWEKEFADLPKDELNAKKHAFVKDALHNVLNISGIELNDNINELIDVSIKNSVANTLPHSSETVLELAENSEK